MKDSAKDIKTIIFDCDGTLLDSFSVHYSAYVTTFAAFGITMDEDLFWQTYSPNWLAVYEAMGLAQADWDRADEIWLDVVANHEAQLFPGVVDLLKDLQDHYLLGMVTSGSKDRIIRDLARTRLREYFPVLVTGGDITKPKPDPQGLLIALQALGSAPLEAIYVGDTHEDFQMAQAAGVPFIGIENRILQAEDHPALAMITSIGDLFPYLR